MSYIKITTKLYTPNHLNVRMYVYREQKFNCMWVSESVRKPVHEAHEENHKINNSCLKH